jgi:hypothetical protein
MLSARVIFINVRKRAVTDRAIDYSCSRLSFHQQANNFLGEPGALCGLPAGATANMQDIHHLTISRFNFQ